MEAAAAAKTAEDARISAHNELEEALGALEEVTTKVAILESQETELKKQVESKTISEDKAQMLEEQKTKLCELEKEVATLREEKDKALQAVESAKESYEFAMAGRLAEIERLNTDVEVHAEQFLLAQTMLDEKESLAAELRSQLEDAKSEFSIAQAQMEEDLAVKSRESANITAELQERTRDVTHLERKLEKLRSEFIEQQSRGLATIAEGDANDEESVSSENDGEVTSSASAEPSSAAKTSHLAELSEKEMQLDRLERELGTSKRQIVAARVELDEKDKATERIKAELEKLRLDKGARVEELELMLEEKNKSMVSVRREFDDVKQSLVQMEAEMKGVKAERDEALDNAKDAEETRQALTAAAEESKAAEQSAKHTCEKLKTQVELLQKVSYCSVREAS